MKKLYVADDDPAMCRFLQLSLKSLADVDAEYFRDGLSLYRAVQARTPDGVVTDIILPKLEGVAVARLMKFDEKYRHVPILVISSVTDADIVEQVAAVRADGFLPKPFVAQAIRDRVTALLFGIAREETNG